MRSILFLYMLIFGGQCLCDACTIVTTLPGCNKNCPTTEDSSSSSSQSSSSHSSEDLFDTDGVSFQLLSSLRTCTPSGGVVTGQSATITCSLDVPGSRQLAINGVWRDKISNRIAYPLTRENEALPIVCSADGWTTADGVPIKSIECSAVDCNENCPTTATGVFSNLASSNIGFELLSTLNSDIGGSGSCIPVGGVVTGQSAVLTCPIDDETLFLNGVVVDVTGQDNSFPIICTEGGWTLSGIPITSIDCMQIACNGNCPTIPGVFPQTSASMPALNLLSMLDQPCTPDGFALTGQSASLTCLIMDENLYINGDLVNDVADFNQPFPIICTDLGWEDADGQLITEAECALVTCNTDCPTTPGLFPPTTTSTPVLNLLSTLNKPCAPAGFVVIGQSASLTCLTMDENLYINGDLVNDVAVFDQPYPIVCSEFGWIDADGSLINAAECAPLMCDVDCPTTMGVFPPTTTSTPVLNLLSTLNQPCTPAGFVIIGQSARLTCLTMNEQLFINGGWMDVDGSVITMAECAPLMCDMDCPTTPGTFPPPSASTPMFNTLSTLNQPCTPAGFVVIGQSASLTCLTTDENLFINGDLVNEVAEFNQAFPIVCTDAGWTDVAGTLIAMAECVVPAPAACDMDCPTTPGTFPPPSTSTPAFNLLSVLSEPCTPAGFAAIGQSASLTCPTMDENLYINGDLVNEVAEFNQAFPIVCTDAGWLDVPGRLIIMAECVAVAPAVCDMDCPTTPGMFPPPAASTPVFNLLSMLNQPCTPAGFVVIGQSASLTCLIPGENLFINGDLVNQVAAFNQPYPIVCADPGWMDAQGRLINTAECAAVAPAMCDCEIAPTDTPFIINPASVLNPACALSAAAAMGTLGFVTDQSLVISCPPDAAMQQQSVTDGVTPLTVPGGTYAVLCNPLLTPPISPVSGAVPTMCAPPPPPPGP